MFATIELEHEMSGDIDVPFDAFSPELQALSVEVADIMKRSVGPLEMSGNPDFWGRSKDLMLFDPVQYG
jgi:hypothetical protein